jgi:hypothetical protein
MLSSRVLLVSLLPFVLANTVSNQQDEDIERTAAEPNDDFYINLNNGLYKNKETQFTRVLAIHGVKPLTAKEKAAVEEVEKWEAANPNKVTLILFTSKNN